jgi:hypothetical protein
MKRKSTHMVRTSLGTDCAVGSSISSSFQQFILRVSGTQRHGPSVHTDHRAESDIKGHTTSVNLPLCSS